MRLAVAHASADTAGRHRYAHARAGAHTVAVKQHLIYALVVVFIGIARAAGWVCVTFDKRVARCHPHNRFSTYVWHEHRFLCWRWLSSHSVLGDGREYRDMIPWAPLDGRGIHVHVYPAGSRPKFL
jgi:hypothetical protein